MGKKFVRFVGNLSRIPKLSLFLFYHKNRGSSILFYIYSYIYIYLYIYKKTSPKWKNVQEQEVFYFRFYILCENFSKIGPIIKKIPKFWDDPLNALQKKFMSHPWSWLPLVAWLHWPHYNRRPWPRSTEMGGGGGARCPYLSQGHGLQYCIFLLLSLTEAITIQ